MEISSFHPFHTQEDYYFHSLFPQPSECTTVSAIFGTHENRRRVSPEDEESGYFWFDEDLKKNTTESPLKDIRSSGSLFQDKDLLQPDLANLNQQPDDYSMKHYIQHLEGSQSPKQNQQQQQPVRSMNKRARGGAGTSTTAATATSPAIVSPCDYLDPAGSSSPSEAAGRAVQQRRLWVKDRSKDWWERCNSPDYPEDEFKRGFRMSRATFDVICGALESVITKKDTMLRAAIPVRQRVAVCIWRLATGEALRLLSRRFGLGISTCHKLVLEVCSAINDVLMPEFVQWPHEGGSRMTMIKQGFESISGIPNVGGSMYTTHVPIIAPKDRASAYFNKRHTERNQKTSYSVTVQGVVDDTGVFTDVCIGWPGSLPDDQVLEKSALCRRASVGSLRDAWLVGGTGYPLLDWLLAPYTHQNLTWTQHAFNEKIGELRDVAKQAFARLKGRWTCLQKRTEVKLQDLPAVLGACCVLHNICEMRKEEMDPCLKFEIFDDEMVAQNGLRSVSSIQARDSIAHNLLHHGPAATSFP